MCAHIFYCAVLLKSVLINRLNKSTTMEERFVWILKPSYRDVYYVLLNLPADFFTYTVLFKNSSNRQSGNFFIIQYCESIRFKNTKEVFYAGVVCLQGWGCNWGAALTLHYTVCRRSPLLPKQNDDVCSPTSCVNNSSQHIIYYGSFICLLVTFSFLHLRNVLDD